MSVPSPGGETVAVGLSKFDVQWLTVQALGDARTIATLPAAYQQMANGDFRGIAQPAVIYRSRLGVQSAMKQMVDLASGATPARIERILGESGTALLGNAINFPVMHLGDAWGRPDLGDDFRQPVRSQVPVLVLTGDLDPRTPVENGIDILQYLPNGHLVVLENATHQFNLFGPPPIRELLSAFLRGEANLASRITFPPIPFQQ